MVARGFRILPVDFGFIPMTRYFFRLPRIARHAPLRWLATALVFSTVSGCYLASLRFWTTPAPSADKTIEVEKIRDISYFSGPSADDSRHRLDLYLPKGMSDYPVVVLVHGGAWCTGDNCHFGLIASVGEFLARNGIGAVLPNYRLSPGIKHPEHIKDVARSVAWARKHMGEYGAASDRLFLVGHSAGGHLVSLLASDERYLEAEGMRISDIKGVISVSGVYEIPPGKQEVALGGTSPQAFRLDELLPVRGEGSGIWDFGSGLPGIPMNLNIFRVIFGNDPEVRWDASPINHVRPGLPPFLIITAEKELPLLAGTADDFLKVLRLNGCEADYLKVEKRNHNSVMYSAVKSDDPVARAILEFVNSRH